MEPHDISTPHQTIEAEDAEAERLPELAYQKRLIRRIILAFTPSMIFYVALYYYSGFHLQAFLLGLLVINALAGVFIGFRIHTTEGHIKLKRVTVVVGFTLLCAGILYGMMRVELMVNLPWIYFVPLGVVLFLGRRTGFYYAAAFCIVAALIVLMTDSDALSTQHAAIFKLNAVVVLFTLLVMAYIAEKTRIRVQKNLVTARNNYQIAEARQREANVELTREIELRIQSENALAQSEMRYRALFEESAVSLWEEDWSQLKSYLDELPQEAADDLSAYFKQNPAAVEMCIGLIKVTAVNRATLNLYEADSTKTLMKNIFAILPPQSADYMLERIVSIYLNGRYNAEHLAQTIHGRKLHLLISSNIPVGYEASFEKVFTSVYDITERVAVDQERKRVEQQLQQARQMQAVATLAGGIAHQFNNALGVIFGGLDLIEISDKSDPKNKSFIGSLKSSANRMSRLTDQLLAYAHGGKYQPKDFSANDLIHNILESKKSAAGPSVRVITDLSPDIHKACGDTTQIKMVLEAVLANAFESMGDGGEVKVATYNQSIDEASAAKDKHLSPGHYAVICVEDNGVGMDPDTCQRIFEPFFTTKFFGRGLGMAAAYGIITNHDGMIKVDSAPKRGTRVLIYLPGADAGEGQPPQASGTSQAMASK